MTAPRAALAALIAPLCPPGWRFLTAGGPGDVPHKTVVTIKQLGITRNPVAPQGAHDVEFVVTITTHFTDPGRAEDDRDTTVNALVHALDESQILWTSARKVLDGDRLAYDITVTLTSTKES